MNIQQDFKELLELLEKNKVDYMIVGGYAVAFHGYPRFTKDIDIFYDSNNQDNINRVIDTLIQFGFTKEELKKTLFSTKGNLVTFGVAPVRVDFINEIDGVDFKDAIQERVRGRYGDLDVFFISKKHLILNKKSTPRIKDLADIEELEG